jgi:hypothetical protein
MNEATNGFPRVVEYKGCAIDPVSTAGSWAPRWTREGKRYDRLPAFATRTKAIEQTKSLSGKWSRRDAFASWGIIAGYDIGTLSD